MSSFHQWVERRVQSLSPLVWATGYHRPAGGATAWAALPGALLSVYFHHPAIRTRLELRQISWKDLPKNILRDQKAIWTSPLHINRNNAKWWVLFGAGTAALIATDKKFNEHLPNSNTQVNASKWASRLGADYSIYPLTALFYFYGKPANNPRAPDTARIGIEALADAEITVNVLKVVTQRPSAIQIASVARDCCTLG